ncbi:hypothetical protein HELRODRAFT_92025 [Helobdella robusta]|uniref:Uncharacterized protein n=1 Tax=Helobdella robusta TaxID=6412 RepID=T1G8B4_HELRO|nr:hypothetical protein HELRODRAFT_92025 [Helobdella robusta]ESO09812.1 hypothetical protein HELRODRAFT_92025 [Helobdella robusta]
MTVFFDNQIQSHSSDEKFVDFAWHGTFKLLAVTSYSPVQGQVVAVFQEEGERLQNSVQRKTMPATCLAWHPSKKVLAVGWSTGEITTQNINDNEISESAKTHQSSICVMHWSTGGSQLLTGDAEGLLIIWKVDGKGRLSSTTLMQHSLNDQPTHLVPIQPPAQDPNLDLHNLAKLAVSGDQSALDMFTWKKPPSKLGNSALSWQEGLTFFIGGSDGRVHYIDYQPSVVEKFKVQGQIKKLLFYDEKNILVTLSSDMMVTLSSVDPESRDATNIMSVKISGQTKTTDMVWAGRGLLATCTGERHINRLWDIDNDENYVLNLNDANAANDDGDVINNNNNNSSSKTLACGTDQGKVVQWKYTRTPLVKNRKKGAEPKDDWLLQNVSNVSGIILDIGFGSSRNLLAVNTRDSLYILDEQESAAACFGQLAVVQIGSMLLSLDDYQSNTHFNLKTDIQIRLMCCTRDNLAVSNGKKVVVYDISGSEKMLKVVGAFDSTSNNLCMHQQNLFATEPGKIQVRNFQGTVKQLLPLPNPDDELTCMDVCGSYLTVATNTGYVKVFDLSRREVKQHTEAKQFNEIIDQFKSIVSAKSNNNGSKVSLIVMKKNDVTDPCLHIWDTETNSVQYFNFETGKDDIDDQQVPITDHTRSQSAKDISGRFPLSHHWDVDDVKSFVCEAKYNWTPEKKIKNKKNNNKGDDNDDKIDVMVITLFCTSEHGVLVQDHYSRDQHCSKLIAINIPYYYFTINKVGFIFFFDVISFLRVHLILIFFNQSLIATCRRIHRNFIGLDLNVSEARHAMLNFSFHLTLGDMDEAFKAIKLIKSEVVWENMAKMCVKTRRLDVAKVCLGNMKNPWAAKLLRESVQKEPQVDAQIACLAVHLGLIEDAERLLKNCKRYDLLNKLYQQTSQWDKALSVAETHDRINLRNTNYNYAKYLEGAGKFQEAAVYFEKSENHGFEVPHMWLNDIKSLENYVHKSNDKSILRWWAQYNEDKGNTEEAIKFYEKSKDHLSLARLYCAMDDVTKAAGVCVESQDRAACYWVGRHFERAGKMQEAISYYNRAQAFGNAIRLCKDHSFDDKLLNMAIMGNTDDMLEAARYYEARRGFEEKATLLYHKAGYSSKALELAFGAKQFSALQTISESFDENTDPLLLQRCAEFFIDNSQFDRAVDLLASAKKYGECLRICREKHVQMNEDLVEKLSPPENDANINTEERSRMLESIGDICMEQRQYHLATKKFTQSGNKIKAMKALLKSGDTERICFFANVSRQKEIYIMAGHYLQSLDWQKDPEIMKNIINFYTRGRSPEHLAGFYGACAQLEIDEYKDYEKALGALSEAYKCLSRCKPTTSNEDSISNDLNASAAGLDVKLNRLKERMTIINKFVKAKRFGVGGEESMQVCQALLSEPRCDEYVKVGDVLAYMTGYFAKTGKWKKAHSCIEELKKRQPNVEPTFYMDKKLIISIYSALNIEYKEPKILKKGNNNDDDDDDVVQREEIYEEDMPIN